VTRRRTRLVMVAALLLPLAGCVSVPESGPVVETDGTRDASEPAGVAYDPLPPLPDASQTDIVRGFLDAMTAVPIQTTTATQFLTAEARQSWTPDAETITYGDRSAVSASQSRVVVRLLDGGNRFDARGAWRGQLTGAGLELSFRLQLEGGEWRISRAPDALIVPETWFGSRYRRYSLSFFDTAAQVLVPEPVFVPSDDALATRLVEGLLDGPVSEPGTRSFFPAGTTLGDLSVPVSSEGVAEVSLSDVGRQSPEAQRLMVVQLVATLRQVPGIESIRVTIDGELLQLPGTTDGRVPMELGVELDPAVPGASSLVFGLLRSGRLVSGDPSSLVPVGGPFGSGDVPLRSVGVSLDGVRAIGISADGRSALLAPTYDDAGDAVRGILDRGTDLLEPSWDVADRAWLIDRRAGGARVRYFEDGRLRALRVPGVSGERVRTFLVSRDGSRLVAVIARGGTDLLVVSRIVHDDAGGVREATPATTILSGTDEMRVIKDIAWQTPTSVAALTKVTGELWDVRSVAVDGAPASVQSLRTVNGPVRSLAGSPVSGQGLLVLAPDAVLDLSGPVSREIGLSASDPPVSLDYVG
jgi:hypothetical protein